METSLTEQQQKFLSNLLGYIRKSGRPPTVREMLVAMKLKSPRSVGQYYEVLEEAGFIRRGKGARNIRVLKRPSYSNSNGEARTTLVPVVGTVACGAPLLAEENLEGHMGVSVNLAKPPHRYFILKAKGDSMDKAGISDGGRVLIRQQSTAEDGDIVVALIDDEATIKRFRRATGVVILSPESSNTNHVPFVLEREFQIQGILVSVLDNQKDERMQS